VESCELFNRLNTECAKPLRHTDDVHEYLPTQFFADWVREHHYDGTRYSSAMSEGGINIFLFDPRVVPTAAVQLVRVDALRLRMQIAMAKIRVAVFSKPTQKRQDTAQMTALSVKPILFPSALAIQVSRPNLASNLRFKIACLCPRQQ
jgi:hypothetical protein